MSSSASSLLYKLFSVLAINSVRKFLTAFGIGVGTGVAMYTLLNTFIQTVVARANEMPYIGLLSLFGIDAGLSIILSAILTRSIFLSTKLSLRSTG